MKGISVMMQSMDLELKSRIGPDMKVNGRTIKSLEKAR